jgi:calcineurin-like phosphoesterase
MYPVARGPVKLHGALIEIDEQSGRALSIERVAHRYVPPEPAPASAVLEIPLH